MALKSLGLMQHFTDSLSLLLNQSRSCL